MSWADRVFRGLAPLSRPTDETIAAVVAYWSQMIPFFPSADKEPLGLEGISDAVAEMVSTNEQLRWLATSLPQLMPVRYEGLPQIRAVYCSRYKPADGIPPSVEVPGLGGADLEAAFARREADQTDARIAEWKRQAALAPPEDSAPFVLPAPRALPEPMPEDRGAARDLMGPYSPEETTGGAA